jgi:hypothetical protein
MVVPFVSKPDNPEEKYISDLDQKMSSILKDTKLNASEKLRQYNQILSIFINKKADTEAKVEYFPKEEIASIVKEVVATIENNHSKKNPKFAIGVKKELKLESDPKSERKFERKSARKSVSKLELKTEPKFETKTELNTESTNESKYKTKNERKKKREIEFEDAINENLTETNNEISTPIKASQKKKQKKLKEKLNNAPRPLRSNLNIPEGNLNNSWINKNLFSK